MTEMSKIKKEFLTVALNEYQRYKSDKEKLNQRVRENDYWYKARYGKLINPKTNETEPATAFIFSAIENKYSDAIDNYPNANIIEREPDDRALSQLLSKIVPVQLDMSGFKKAYKTNWRRKLKHGTGIYGVFYNGDNIVIKALSILNVYCDMHLDNVQDSRFLFIVNAVDNELLKEQFPAHCEKFSGGTTIENFDGVHEIKGRTEIIDCYYKKGGNVHCMKLCKNEIISSTEDGDFPEGLYRHGMYPVVFDVLYPEEDCPFGFGIIDISKNPQAYIDRLDGAIIKNAILTSKTRFMIKDNGSVNEEEVLDYENDVIHVAGGVDNDSIRELQVSGLQEFVREHRNKKIDELKEVVGNRDFQQGGTNNGVTAASAISVLQEAGNKLSRTMIDDAYDAYRDIVFMMIELMREFYESERIYRISGDGDEDEYAAFSSSMMNSGTEPAMFDINIVAQKQNPFQKEAGNQLILTLWSAGFFNPQTTDYAIIALQAMNFEGKENVIKMLNEQKEKSTSGKKEGLVPVEQTLAMLEENAVKG